MITSQEAYQIIQQYTFPQQNEKVALLSSKGRILAESITADRDFPPFNRVAMDGIAFAFEGINPAAILVEQIQFAGETQKQLQDTHACIEIMTGAILPSGCDTVVRYEDVTIEEIEGKKIAKITIPFEEITLGQNVHRQGSDKIAGQILLEAGIRISPAEIAVMASVGKQVVEVVASPKVAVISTGDELVDIAVKPESHQIRMSNSYMLAAALQTWNIEAQLFHLTDDPEVLTEKLTQILEEHDVILLSGGVSAGKKDYVPEILAQLGVKKCFHKVAQKPGKPFWFGTKDVENNEGKKLVFALPGNPVSTFLCFCKYALPVIAQQKPKVEQVSLAKEVFFKPNLTYFAPAQVYFDNGKMLAIPFEGSGSADFANLTNCDGFVELPSEKTHFEIGEIVNFVRFR